MNYSIEYYWCCWLSFRDTFRKSTYYAAVYGNYIAVQTMKDFQQMYNMGQEL